MELFIRFLCVNLSKVSIKGNRPFLRFAMVLANCNSLSKDELILVSLSLLTLPYDDLICYLWEGVKSIGVLHLLGGLLPTAGFSSLSPFPPPQNHCLLQSFLAVGKVDVF